MQSWEKERREKLYREKIVNAKPQVPVSNKKKSSKAINDSRFSASSSLSGYTNKEKEDKDQIPLYKLLKMYNLQQYAQQLISRGFGYDLIKFALLSHSDLDGLADDIKLLPGHKVKLYSLVDYMSNIVKVQEPQLCNPSKSIMQATTYSKKTQKRPIRKSAVQTQRLNRPVTSSGMRSNPQINNQQVTQGKGFKCRVKQLGYDFFQDEESASGDELNLALNKIIEKYKNEPLTLQEKPLNFSSTNQLRQVTTGATTKRANDDIALITQFKGETIETVLRENKLLKNLEKKLSTRRKMFQDDGDVPQLQLSQIKHMYISYESGKLTSTLVNLDIEEMCNCLAWCIQKHISFQKKINRSILKNSSIPLSMDYRFRATGTGIANQDLSQNPVEEPTQINFEINQQQIQTQLFQSQQLFKSEGQKKYIDTLAQISEKTFDIHADTFQVSQTNKVNYHEFESQRNQIHGILKESYMFLTKQKDQAENNDDLLADREDEALSQDEASQNIYYDEDFSPIKPMHIQQHQLIKHNNISTESLQHAEDPIYNYSQSLPIQQEFQPTSLFQSKLDFVEDEENQHEMKKLYLKTFTDQKSETVIPSVEVISDYCKNIIITSKMEKEVTILCLVYIERLLTESGMNLEPITWRRVVFIGLIISSKIWDDESFENDNFAKVFPQYRTQEINELERVFLILIDYRLHVKQGDYAKYYFLLRSYVEQKKKSFPLRPLDLNTILKLQKNCNNAEFGLKQKYQQASNKSF